MEIQDILSITLPITQVKDILSQENSYPQALFHSANKDMNISQNPQFAPKALCPLEEEFFQKSEAEGTYSGKQGSPPILFQEQEVSPKALKISQLSDSKFIAPNIVHELGVPAKKRRNYVIKCDASKGV
ncbi:uncharacterized protein G2W53_027223 [Senna tora]|uniref:Uncharacterized protein n=1 Tax=Senna tora TaxID=362788 RepID=A0A834TGP6_9FABA|nr:uncharacterized protein G2W53_027223 [Senna tora]